MSRIAQISEDLKIAMKAGEAEKRDTLRFLQSALKNVAIEKHKDVNTLDDAEVEEVVKRLVKQRKDSIAQYRAGQREDLAQKEEGEMALLSTYLPEAMSEEAVERLVDETLSELGTVGPQDMGRVMGTVMKKAAGQADGTLVREIVQKRLTP